MTNKWLHFSVNDTNFASALEQLRYYSLIETTGSLEAPIYRLHRLTVTLQFATCFMAQSGIKEQECKACLAS